MELVVSQPAHALHRIGFWRSRGVSVGTTMITNDDIWSEYAQRLGVEVETLTDEQKRKACIDVIQDGFDAFRDAYRPIEQFFEDLVLELERKRSSENRQ